MWRTPDGSNVGPSENLAAPDALPAELGVHAPKFEVAKLAPARPWAQGQGHGGAAERRVGLADEVGLQLSGLQVCVELQELRFVSDLENDGDGVWARRSGLAGSMHRHRQSDAYGEGAAQDNVVSWRGLSLGAGVGTAAVNGCSWVQRRHASRARQADMCKPRT